MTTEHWPAYGDPAGRYSLRHPPGWTVTSESVNRTVFQDPGLRAVLAIEYSDRDCDSAESALRQRRLNYYLVREFTQMIGDREARVFELRDTISNVREFRTFFVSAGACCELKWTHPSGSDVREFESTQEAMLSTLDFTNNQSRG